MVSPISIASSVVSGVFVVSTEAVFVGITSPATGSMISGSFVKSTSNTASGIIAVVLAHGSALTPIVDSLVSAFFTFSSSDFWGEAATLAADSLV